MNSSEPSPYDVAVIGAGSAGYAAARTAASHGLKTTVIEGSDEVGGLCILRGCMPTKALLYAAEVMHIASHPEPWGIRTGQVTFDFAKVMARKNTLIREFADYRISQLTSGRFDFIRARAAFVDAHTLELHPLDGAPPRTLAARHFIIATGSTHAAYPLPDLDSVGCLNSDTALNLTALPKSLIVLGGGAVALEFAQFFVRFGVKVTLIQRSAHVLHGVDLETAEVIEDVFRKEGVTVYTGTKLLQARRVGDSKEIAFDHGDRTVRVQAEEVFFALGRSPNIASLRLENAGVDVEHGRIRTSATLQTSVPHNYAAGDCAGPHEIVHLGIQQGEIAARNIARPERPDPIDYRLLTEVIFTDPQIASVGLTEKRAHVQNIPFMVARHSFSDHGKSLIMEARHGFVKLLTDPGSGEIIGGACVGPMAGELIHEIIAAMSKRMTVRELAAMPHYHPTLAEIWTYPAEELAEQLRPS
jgi:pyruvate/2-oxoglutarate dehydrogenase complex dihydrolipoamide dehydrogenase (E3) component